MINVKEYAYKSFIICVGFNELEEKFWWGVIGEGSQVVAKGEDFCWTQKQAYEEAKNAVDKIQPGSRLKKVVYLANPYGFSQQQRSRLLPSLVEAIESLGFEVWEPFARNDQSDFSTPGWAHRVAQADVNDVKQCDAIFAVVNGTPPDEGVMVELGIAIALEKQIFLFRDDFRRCTDSEDYPLNLMVFSGLPQQNWQDYYYTSIEEIQSPDKALWRWANE